MSHPQQPYDEREESKFSPLLRFGFFQKKTYECLKETVLALCLHNGSMSLNVIQMSQGPCEECYLKPNVSVFRKFSPSSSRQAIDLCSILRKFNRI